MVFLTLHCWTIFMCDNDNWPIKAVTLFVLDYDVYWLIVQSHCNIFQSENRLIICTLIDKANNALIQCFRTDYIFDSFLIILYGYWLYT